MPSSSSPSTATRSDKRKRSPALPPTQTRRESPQLRALLIHLASERGLAENSLLAYRRDLEDLDEFLSRRKLTLKSATADDFRAYLRDQTQRRKSTRTVARRLAAIRVFLTFREVEGEDVTHIRQQLERPKPERSLPKILSRDQVNQLIAAPIRRARCSRGTWRFLSCCIHRDCARPSCVA
jgi:site-specific recombinase XerD